MRTRSSVRTAYRGSDGDFAFIPGGYDDGDDQMKKTLGEAMLKSRQKQAGGASGLDDLDDGIS